MNLPPEILQIIFSFCSVTDLLGSVQHVCQQWRKAVLSPWVWRKKVLTLSGHQTSKELKLLLMQLPFLKNVLVKDVNREAVTLLSENCPLLEYLCIDDCDHVDFLPAHIQISQFDYLRYIDFRFKKVYCLEGILSLNCDSRFPPLLHTIIFRKAVSDGGFLLFLLETCKFLQHVVVSHLDDFHSFLESSLQNTDFIGKTDRKHTVHTFYMSLLYASGTSLKYISLLEKISAFCELKCLGLKCNQFQDEDILQSIFRKPHPELVFLDLSYSFNLTTNAFHSVINLCPNLLYLSLERCDVTNATVSVILSVMSQLQFLNLHGTLVSSQCFPSIPMKLPKLRDLNLCLCRGINDAVVHDLVCTMPNLIIVLPRKGVLKGALAVERDHSFVEHRNSLHFFEVRKLL